MKGPLGCISHAILEGLAELVREPRSHIPLALSPCERSGVGSTSVVRVDERISVKSRMRGADVSGLLASKSTTISIANLAVG